MRKLSLVLVFILASCAGRQDDLQPAPPLATSPPPVVTAPPPKAACVRNRPWSDGEMDDLNTALTPLPASSIFWTLELDWQAMRDGNSACTASANQGK